MDHTTHTTSTSCNALESLSAIIFWGSIWGIIEATVGSVIRSTGLPYMGLLLYFLAMPCLAVAYRQTGMRMSSVYIACVAAAIKCVSLPFVKHEVSIIPTLLIILVEGLMMSAFITVAQVKPLPRSQSVVFKPMVTTVVLTIAMMLTIAI